MADEKKNAGDAEATQMVWFDKMDGKEYRISFEHAKLLYLISHYARTSKSDEQPETWMRGLSLDVLMFEGIVAGKLDFDYAPVSREFAYADDVTGEFKVKRAYLNISQEGKSAVDDLMEQDFVKSLKVPNGDNATTTAFQVSHKALDLLQSLPPILRVEVDDFLYKRKSYRDRVHPTKDLLNVLTDKKGFILVTANGFEARSSVTEVEDVSYVTSPFLPWTYRYGELLCTDNSTRAWESGVGISQVKKELNEAIVLSQVNILIMEWIPTAANEFSSLLDRFGVKTRNPGGRFTSAVDQSPNRQLVQEYQGLTRVELLDYKSSQAVNFEAEIQFAEDDGVKQVEFIGIHLHTMGAIASGFRVEAIQNRLADDISCDLMSRMMVDAIQDTSRMLNDLLTASQRRFINTIYRGNAPSRSKFCLIYADKADPSMQADCYKDGGEYENELRQVLGEIRHAKDIGKGGEIIIEGSEGMLIVGRRLRKYDRISVLYGEIMGMQAFMKNSFGRLSLLMGEVVRLQEALENGDQDPESFDKCRHLRNSVASDLAIVEEIVTYLDASLEHLSIPHEPLEDIGKILYEFVDIKGSIQALESQLDDIRKLVKGCRNSVNNLGREVRILQTKKERRAALSLDRNSKGMVQVSDANRRSTAVFGILHGVLGCSFGLLLLDAFISARAKYFGMKSMFPAQDLGEGSESSETSVAPDLAALSSVEVSDPTAGGSYFPMQAAIIFDQAPIVGTFASHVVFMGIFIYLLQKAEGFFQSTGARTVRCKFFKKINPQKMDEYINSKDIGIRRSYHVEAGDDRGNTVCEKIIRFVPPAPFPWTWHGHAPLVEMRVDLANAMLISATFKRGESLPFWKWLIYNQILRRHQKMSMMGHYDELMVDRFLKNLEEADIFTEWVPEKVKDMEPVVSLNEIDIQVDDQGNPLDVLGQMEHEHEAESAGRPVTGEYDRWPDNLEEVSSRPATGVPVYASEDPLSGPTRDEEAQRGIDQETSGWGDAFRRRIKG